MTDYTKLVKALRICCKGSCVDCDRQRQDKCLKRHWNNENLIDGMLCEAAAAIEELQFELGCVNDSVKMLSLPIDGKWIRVEGDDSYHYECSRCGERPLYSRFGDVVLSGTCPMCGAKMTGEQDVE